MDFKEVVEKRRSIRKFKTEPVSIDLIRHVLEAARLAPTWANMQGIRYIVINEKDQVAKVADAIGQKWCKSAPMFIAAISDEKWSGKNGGMLYFMLDVGIAFEHLILAATNEGLGTCWIGAFNEEKLKEILGIKKSNRVVALTPLGHPDETPGDRSRKNLSEIAFRDTFGNHLDL